ncbi:MAG TPA: ABC transporter substrate-binding protein, partial [Chloroflexota bacterium]|nr:ABC transporter substrate-binding protein [Chloroflexota bacterium]
DALCQGGLDVAADLPAQTLRAARTRPGIRLHRTAGTRQIVLRIDPAFPPFDQPKVREALARALPYETVTRNLNDGRVESPPAVQDHRVARTLLREAAYGSGFRLSLHLSEGNPDLQAVAHSIQVDAMRLDIKFVLEVMESGLFSREKAARHLPLYLDERRPVVPWLSAEEAEPLRQVETVVVAQLAAYVAARSGIDGFVRHPDRRPRYFELRKP